MRSDYESFLEKLLKCSTEPPLWTKRLKVIILEVFKSGFLSYIEIFYHTQFSQRLLPIYTAVNVVLKTHGILRFIQGNKIGHFQGIMKQAFD